MSNTATKRLGDIVNFKRGYDLPSYSRKEGIYPIISSGGISGYHSEYKIEGEGLITGRYGTLGEMYYVNGKYWPHNTALYVTDFKGNYPKYVYYSLKCLGNLKTSDKSTVPGINRNDLHEIIIPYIQPELQKPIADFLTTLDAKIALNNRINAELEAMAKTLYDYWFVQFDFPNSENRPYKTSGGAMVWNEDLKREIPEGWEVKKIDEIATLKAGGDKPKIFSPNRTSECSIPIYSNGITNEGLYGYTNTANVLKPSITISARGTIGYSMMRKKPFVPIIRLIVVIPHITESIKYFDEYIKTMEFEKSGSVQQQLTVPQVCSLNMLYPPMDILKKFNEITLPTTDKVELLKKENQQLSALRDWLLPMLMNGQVVVE